MRTLPTLPNVLVMPLILGLGRFPPLAVDLPRAGTAPPARLPGRGTLPPRAASSPMVMSWGSLKYSV